MGRKSGTTARGNTDSSEPLGTTSPVITPKRYLIFREDENALPFIFYISKTRSEFFIHNPVAIYICSIQSRLAYTLFLIYLLQSYSTHTVTLTNVLYIFH